ncbi:MAG: fructose-bisphosphatase class III [Methylococcales bacterium]|jgi:fructose-1,6-bisphosphatase III|nr:fructose-bisphosphatase class III [Methylococcales bacterium]MBT7444561.1 fructose-bisphosphatase class III [Methylococcales bacterium]
MNNIVRERKLSHVVFEDAELDHLRSLAKQYPTIEAAVSRQAMLNAEMSLPKGMSHAFSDIHGEIKKLRHVINNASGRIRPLVESLFKETLSSEEINTLLQMIYYPQESLAYLQTSLEGKSQRLAFAKKIIQQQLLLLRALGKHYPLSKLIDAIPKAYRDPLMELLFAKSLHRDEDYINAIFDTFMQSGKLLEIIRLLSRAVRNFSVDELIIAGDLGDRGPRVDKVVEYLMHQPTVSITWGNHDVSWMGACLGHEGLIAVVLRISLRYGQIAQLEEGYGIPLDALEELANATYGDDPLTRFIPKYGNFDDPKRVARMQKAIAVIQLKLEGQIVQRNPQYNMDDRNLLHKLNVEQGTVELDGTVYDLLDNYFPTIDMNDPYALSAAEQACMDQLRQLFMESAQLWRHMSYLFQQGDMYIKRDNHLIFHGCIPVEEDGSFQSFTIDGEAYKGEALFDVFESAMLRAWRKRDPKALDLVWYLWTGPLSPLFGKDKMATFESYFIAEKSTHKEAKNPYYKLIHEASFCQHIFTEFGVDPELGLLVNGHVPVNIEKGESPIKNSGAAVTIDGAFSEAYGDKGYTLVLDADKTSIASLHHFESIEEAITNGADIIPELVDIKVFPKPRKVGDTRRGKVKQREVDTLARLILAYEENVFAEGNRERRTETY